MVERCVVERCVVERCVVERSVVWLCNVELCRRGAQVAHCSVERPRLSVDRG
jgi:hypothetical protein